MPLTRTVFEITAAGKLTTLHSFCVQAQCPDGAFPYAGLVQATNGSFYGTTFSGGANEAGTVFKITPAGTLTTIYSFCAKTNCADGNNPTATLVQATNGNFYGTTSAGGVNGDYGTVFKITAAGKLTTLHSFDGTDGEEPLGGLLQATSGTFYGTTEVSTTTGYGTVFRLSTGLGPFVETQRNSGKEGATINILGQGFTSSSIVKFGGVQATTVSLNGTTDLIATVPAGALTGSVTVTTGAST